MILDANTGAVLHADEADELRRPASLTKMMTLYLAFETLQSGRMTMSDRIKISQEAANQAPSKLELEPGEEITVSDAVRALITKSANDVAVALAEKIGGSEKNFVRLMNTRARDLGMSKTHFENASGLPNDDQVTTARDMITLGLRLQDDFPNYYPLFATRQFRFNRASYRNHNTLLHSFQGIDGIKTGYTQKSGFNLVSSVRRGGRHVVGAVFGGSSAASRNGEMRALLSRALARASTVKTRKPAPQLIAKLKSAPVLAERPKPKDKPAVEVAAVSPPVVRPFAPAAKPAPTEIKAPQPRAALAPVAKPAAVQQPTPIVEPAKAETGAFEPEAAPVAIAGAAPAPVDVFKVKRIMVAPRQGPRAPAVSADQTTDMPPADSANDPIAESLTVLPPSAPEDNSATLAATDQTDTDTETVIAKTTLADATAVRVPSALDNRASMLGARDVAPPPVPIAQGAPKSATMSATMSGPISGPMAAQPVKSAAPRHVVKAAATLPAMPIERGRAPSSLQAQASQFSAVPQRMASLQPAAAPAQAPATGATRYEIQIGAYSSIDEAQRALSSAQTRAAALLAAYPSVTHPVQKAGRQVFRARFTGFDSARAARTCTELRRQAIDCFVMTAE